ncbi:DUF4158 domain-containing protein [Sphingomonas sp. UYEF23]|uniref:DUF4158 domain-containing protein n=1 Tax=Sphingomonas sp. UYEF23 TaxID=1756408 RepID=UPI003394F71E
MGADDVGRRCGRCGGDLLLHWRIGFDDLALLEAKPLSSRLGFAVQLLTCRATGRFVRVHRELPSAVIAYLAEQTGARVPELADYDWLSRSGRRHRAEILRVRTH